ncbi:MAG: hypothetical protein COB02_16585 [Candidatus Cloacimonadota bacterium]|nr:MAG: hypothetical protein COB02_16585 [Candidatus Cloacimonadota bacterium]
MIERNNYNGIEYVIYRPEQYSKIDNLPVVVLFRGHPDEWFQSRQDTSRGKRNSYLVINDLITKGYVKPAAYLFPATCNSALDEYYFCHDLKAPKQRNNQENYLTHQNFETEFLPDVCKQYNLDENKVSLDGFSLGGYTSLVYSFLSPEKYISTGSFDGAILNYETDNIKLNPKTTSDLTFDSFPYIFGGIPSQKDFESIDPLFKISNDFIIPKNLFISGTNCNLENSNKPRVKLLLETMQSKNINNHCDASIIDINSSHEWFWVDEYLYRALPFHTHKLNK